MITLNAKEEFDPMHPAVIDTIIDLRYTYAPYSDKEIMEVTECLLSDMISDNVIDYDNTSSQDIREFKIKLHAVVVEHIRKYEACNYFPKITDKHPKHIELMPVASDTKGILISTRSITCYDYEKDYLAKGVLTAEQAIAYLYIWCMLNDKDYNDIHITNCQKVELPEKMYEYLRRQDDIMLIE